MPVTPSLQGHWPVVWLQVWPAAPTGWQSHSAGGTHKRRVRARGEQRWRGGAAPLAAFGCPASFSSSQGPHRPETEVEFGTGAAGTRGDVSHAVGDLCSVELGSSTGGLKSCSGAPTRGHCTAWVLGWGRAAGLEEELWGNIAGADPNPNPNPPGSLEHCQGCREGAQNQGVFHHPFSTRVLGWK